MNILLIGGNGFVGKELIKQATNKSLNISYLDNHLNLDLLLQSLILNQRFLLFNQTTLI